MKFVDDIQDAWTWFSMRLITAAFVWETLPEDLKAAVTPDVLEPYVTAILLVAAGFGRVIKQDSPVQ